MQALRTYCWLPVLSILLAASSVFAQLPTTSSRGLKRQPSAKPNATKPPAAAKVQTEAEKQAEAAADESTAEKADSVSIPPDLFERLDAAGRGIIIKAELTPEQLKQYGAVLDRIDRNHDGLITRAEFEAATAPSLLGNPHTYAALLLVLAFAGFCIFIDSLFDADRRDYVWWGLGLWLAPMAVGFLLAREWYLGGEPYLVWIVLVCLVLLGIAFALGATKPVEVATVETGEKVYVIGAGGTQTTVVRQGAGGTRRAAGTGTGRTTRTGTRPRTGSLAPGRVARRPPPSRPEPPPRPPNRPSGGTGPAKKPPPKPPAGGPSK